MSVGTPIDNPRSPDHPATGSPVIDTVWGIWNANISAVLRSRKNPLEISDRIKMQLYRYSRLLNLEVGKPLSNHQLSSRLPATSTALLQVLKFAVVSLCFHYHGFGLEEVLKRLDQRQMETKSMIPHDDKGLGGNCHRDTARLLLLSIAQAVECNAEGDRYFRQERYHEALQHYLSATIKLMPWDTSVLSLGLSNSSGFFDAEFAIMSNIFRAGTRVMEQVPYAGPHWAAIEAGFLKDMLSAAIEYQSLSPAYSPGASKEYDNVLRTAKPGPLAGRIGSVIIARSRAPVSRGTLFFSPVPKGHNSILYQVRTPEEIREMEELGQLSADMLPGMVPLGTLLGWIRFLGEGGVRGEAAAEQKVVETR